jgi:cysteine desulfurase/selenocysteine lyase
MLLDSYRSLFPVAQNCTFLNHAAVSPLSLRVFEEVRTVMEELTYRGIGCYPKWMTRVGEARSLFAKLINAEANEIAFTGNTSEGLSTIAGGLKWKSGDVVLVPVPDFPANIYPWINLERSGVGIRYVDRKEKGRLRADELEDILPSRTRLLTVSSVDFSTGFAADLEALGDLCRRKGILFCVDAIQSLGVLPMDVKKYGIHFLATGAHKWLLSTMGTGALFVSSDACAEVNPVKVGWKSVVDEEDFFCIHFDLKPDAKRFEPGTMNITGISALGAAIRLILEAGVGEITKKIFALNDVLYEGLSSRGLKIATSMEASERSGILSFLPAVDPGALFRMLAADKVMVSLRGDKIRLSPHFYNNVEDIDAFFRALDSALGRM